MELSKCVIFLLNILLYSGRIDFVFLHNMNEGSSKGSETDGYAKNVENLVNDKRTINTLRKINSGKSKNNNDNDLHEALAKRLEMKEKLSKIWLPAVHKIWKYWHKSGARQVMNTITSKLVRHASDKITKHVGSIIRSSVSSQKSITDENAQVRSPNPLSSSSSLVLPAQSIAKLNDRGFDNTTVTANVKDLKSSEATTGNASIGENKPNETAHAQNNATQLTNTSQPTNVTNNALPDNTTTSTNHSFTIKYQSDDGEVVDGTKQNAAHALNDSSSLVDINNNAINATNNATTSKSGNVTTKYSDVPIANASVENGFLRSEISQQPPAVSSFVSAPPIGPMESITIDLKGKASTFKNFSKDNREHELFRPSKTEILNFVHNSILSADNIVKSDSNSNPNDGPISNELESTLMVKRSPSKAIRSSLPFQPISSSKSSQLPSPVTSESRKSRGLEGREKKDKDEGDEQEVGSSGESGDGDNEEIDNGQRKYKLKSGGKRKGRHHKQKKLSVESTKKVTPIRKVPILTINTDDSIKSTHPSNKVTSKKHKHRSDYSKTHTDDTSLSSHQKRKHHNGSSTTQKSRYKVYHGIGNATNMLETEPERDGMVNIDLSGLTNNTLKGLSDKIGINSIEVEGEHKPQLGDPVTFTLGHNGVDELPQNLLAKGPLHAGHNHAGEAGIDHNLSQDKLVKGHEQGPLLPGHEQGPLLPGHEQGPLLVGQDHPGDFTHHEDGLEDKYSENKLQGEGKWNHHVQPSGPNYVEEPLQVPPVPAEINPGIPNAVSNFPNAPRLGLNLPSRHPILSIQGLMQPPLNNPALLEEEENACAQHPPLAPQVAGTMDCPPHHEFLYHQSETANVSPENEKTKAPTLGPPTLPFEIPSHHKFEKLGHNIEPELLSVIEENNQQVTSLSHEVKNIESRLGNVESIVEVLEKAVYRIEEKVDKLNNPMPTYTQREEFSSATEEPPHNPRHPLLKQYFVPLSPNNPYDGMKEIDRTSSNGGLPWPVNKVVSYLLQEIQKSKNKQQPILQLQSTPHVPLPQPEMAYPPKEHDIDRLEYEIGRTPKSKFGHKIYHYDLDNPCQCENGGECNGRSDGCDCPLRFTGPRCERPVPRSSLLDSIIDEIPPDTQQQYHAPKKTSLITLPLVISENNDDQDPIAQKTVGEVNQSKLVNLLSQFFSPDYLQRFAKREKVSTRRYVKYPLEKEK